MKAVRRSAKQLVALSRSRVAKKGWFEGLPPSDQKYVREVVAVMRSTPEAAPYVVARMLMSELGISRHIETVAKTLKDMVNNDKA